MIHYRVPKGLLTDPRSAYQAAMLRSSTFGYGPTFDEWVDIELQFLLGNHRERMRYEMRHVTGSVDTFSLRADGTTLRQYTSADGETTSWSVANGFDEETMERLAARGLGVRVR